MSTRLWSTRCGIPIVLLCLLLVMLVSTRSALGQPTSSSCKVLDPELQISYDGGCVNGLAEGNGDATGTARYSGSFKAGKKHGKGRKFWPATGDRYEGEFAQDRKEGAGTYVWGANSAWPGEKYSGAFLNDQRHGYGTYEWLTNDRYTGLWEYDQATGPTTPMMRARARAYIEAKAAVARPGINVCREMKIGIATRERIKGMVMTVDEDGINVRIDDAGHMGHVIRGADIRKGTLVKDDFPNWMPC
jgi:hypothetical protein